MPHRQFTGRRIKKNHSSTLPRYIVAFATETKQSKTKSGDRSWNHSLRAGVVKFVRLSDGKLVGLKKLTFTTGRQFWDSIYDFSRRNFTTWLVSHNTLFNLLITQFTAEVVEARVSLSRPRAKRSDDGSTGGRYGGGSLCVIDSPPTIVGLQVAVSGGRVIAVDLMNWFRSPLSELGRICELTQLDRPALDSSDDYVFDYCERNCDITLTTFVNLMQWASDNDVGVFKYTAAGQSMAAFRHRFMTREIFVHDNRSATEIERQSYFGGRTEVFKIGEISEPVWQLDINSLFPWAMSTSKVPFRLTRSEDCSEWTEIRPPIQFSSSVCEVMIRTNRGVVPCRRFGMTIYPVGHFATTLCGEELKYAAESGLITHFRNWATYDCDVLFDAFVRHFYSLRQYYKRNKHELYDTFAKGILNSLYGKFAQLAPRWVDEPDRLDAEPWSTWVELDHRTGEPTQYRSFGYCIQRRVADEPHANSFTAISAFITSAARLRMNQLRETAGKYNVYYQGVDGLIVTQSGYENLCSAGEIGHDTLGKLRVVLATNYGHIHSIGDYRIGSKVAIGGLSREYRTTWDGSYLQRSFVARNNLFTEDKNNVVSEIERNWKRSGKYNKGDVTANGWISPLYVDDSADREAGNPCGTDAACSANRSTTDGYSSKLFPE